MANNKLTVVQCADSEKWRVEIQKVLPKQVLVEAFLRVTRSTASEKKFSACDPRSFFGALLKCARAGLMPDGVHAHLIPFGGEVGCIFDWKGLVALAQRNGLRVVAKVVCEKDEFQVEEDDGSGRTVVRHKWGVGTRGPAIAYYVRTQCPDGTFDYEFMSREEIESVRQNYSNAKNSKAWEKSFDEMAKKTVIKRQSKRWDISQEAREALNQDDDPIDATVKPVLSRPVFARTEKSVEAIEPPKEAEKVKYAAEIQKIRNLCIESNITDKTLVDFLVGLGSMEEGSTVLEELPEHLVASVIRDWPDLITHIKESQQ